jgi:hypothetical protein
MKALKLFIFGSLIFLAGTIQAQVSVNVNLGSPPPWGPYGYNEVRYYYLPDVESYYDVQNSMFIYRNGNEWVHSKYLPRQYRSYDLYGGYKVVMTDYHGNTPYTYFSDHKIKYSKGYHGQPQKTVGEKPGKERSDNGKNSGKEKGGGHGNDKK